MERRSSQGFTLVELMIVVVIMGVLATLAVYGVRQYINNAKTSEVFAMITSIQAAEENIRDETFQYFSASSSLTALYPGDPGPNKMSWESSHADALKWRQLGVSANGPVAFRYAVIAGGAGTTPGLVPDAPSFGWDSVAATGPWYVIRAAGDQDGDTVLSAFVASSFTNEVWVNNKFE